MRKILKPIFTLILTLFCEGNERKGNKREGDTCLHIILFSVMGKEVKGRELACKR